MKTSDTIAAALRRNVEQAKSKAGRKLAEARVQKRRVKMRLHALRGDEIRPPSRGPIQPNNKRPCIRWHFWQMAQAKQDYITQQITAVCSLMSPPNDQGQPRAEKT